VRWRWTDVASNFSTNSRLRLVNNLRLREKQNAWPLYWWGNRWLAAFWWRCALALCEYMWHPTAPHEKQTSRCRSNLVALLQRSAQSSLFTPDCDREHDARSLQRPMLSSGPSFLADIAKLPKTPRRRKDVAPESYRNTIVDVINTLLKGLEPCEYDFLTKTLMKLEFALGLALDNCVTRDKHTLGKTGE
jgi:hypothetical protein